MVVHDVGFGDGELGEEEGDVGRGFGVGFVEDSFFDGGHGGCWCGVAVLSRLNDSVCVCVCVCWLEVLLNCPGLIFRGTSYSEAMSTDAIVVIVLVVVVLLVVFGKKYVDRSTIKERLWFFSIIIYHTMVSQKGVFRCVRTRAFLTF